MSDAAPDDPGAKGCDADLVIVGGGPTGCSAGVFTGRAGLDSLVFDRGRSSIKRCAHLENYLGFPAGIDVETLYALVHEHAEAAGCRIVPDLVESVERDTAAEAFVVETQEGRSVTARRVVAATRYDAAYLRPLDADRMFETHEYDGEERELFDRSYPAADGTTPIDGLYVAAPSAAADAQAIIAAGHGARVARRVIADARIDDGWWEEAASDGVDWARRTAGRDTVGPDREAWTEWFDGAHADDAPVDPDSNRFRRVRDEYVDETLSSYLDPDEIGDRTAAAHETLAGHLDVEAVVSGIGEDALLAAIDDDAIHAYADERAIDPEAR